jgi:glutathione S-transferase
MFAALSTIEPPIVNREIVTRLERDKTWYEERLPAVQNRIRDRLGELSNRAMPTGLTVRSGRPG